MAKNAIYQVDNGTSFDEIHFKTNANMVEIEGEGTLKSWYDKIKFQYSFNSATGYFKFPAIFGGLAIQWARFEKTANSSGYIWDKRSFPLAFTSVYAIMPTNLQVENNVFDACNFIVGTSFYSNSEAILTLTRKDTGVTGGLRINLGWIAIGRI